MAQHRRTWETALAWFVLFHAFFIPVVIRGAWDRIFNWEAETRLRIINATGEDLRVTPIGGSDRIHDPSRKRPLEDCIGPGLSFLTGRRSRFRLGAGDAITVTFDRDVWKPSDMVIETEGGRTLLMERPRSEGGDDPGTWRIRGLDDLPEPGPIARMAYVEARLPKRVISSLRFQYFRFLCIAFPGSVLLGYLRARRKAASASRTTEEPGPFGRGA